MGKEKGNNIKDTISKGILKENKKVMIVSILILIMILIIILFSVGYSKYSTIIRGSSNSEVAHMICNMNVVPSEENRAIINPYCTVTVRNFDSDDKITETDVNYKISVTPKEDFVMPEYYWQDSNGRIVARSAEVTGKFKNGEKGQDEYKIVFLHSGEEDVTRLIEFNLTAIQGN